MNKLIACLLYTSKALSDGAQSLTPDQFDEIAKRIFKAKKAFDSCKKN